MSVAYRWYLLYTQSVFLLKGLPAALANQAFGVFLDQKCAGSYTKAACQTVSELMSILSDDYIDTTNETLLKSLKATFGPQFVGKTSNREKAMLSLVRESLLKFFRQVMAPDICFQTLEPSLVSEVSCASLVY